MIICNTNERVYWITTRYASAHVHCVLEAGHHGDHQARNPAPMGTIGHMSGITPAQFVGNTVYWRNWRRYHHAEKHNTEY